MNVSALAQAAARLKRTLAGDGRKTGLRGPVHRGLDCAHPCAQTPPPGSSSSGPPL